LSRLVLKETKRKAAHYDPGTYDLHGYASQTWTGAENKLAMWMINRLFDTAETFVN